MLYNQLITYHLRVHYLLRIQQYPVNNTCNRKIYSDQSKKTNLVYCFKQADTKQPVVIDFDLILQEIYCPLH